MKTGPPVHCPVRSTQYVVCSQSVVVNGGTLTLKAGQPLKDLRQGTDSLRKLAGRVPGGLSMHML